MVIASSRRRWTDLSPRTVHLFLALSLLLIVGVVGALGRATWNADTQRASSTADNLSAMIEQDIRRTLALYDLSIQATRDAVLNPTVMAAPQDLRDRILFDRASSSAYLGSILVLDPTGTVVAASHPVPPRAASNGDRDYFRIHALDPNFGLYVSRPLVSRLSTPHYFLRKFFRGRGEAVFSGSLEGNRARPYAGGLWTLPQPRSPGTNGAAPFCCSLCACSL